MRFATPRMFWLLVILVPPLIFFFWWAWRRRQQLVTQFISARLLGHLKVGFSPSRQKARMALNVIAVIFLIFTLARPQWGMTHEEARQRGLDIIVAVDTSNSMLAQDVSPNRLARAKLAALDLMRRAKTDRLGLIAFAGDAFLECPLTLDDAAFSQSVNALDTHTISQGGTAIGEAIAEARKSFKNESDNHKVLVLFTDGEDHDSEAAAEAEKAAKEGMIIFTIGIGTPEGDQILIRDERGHVEPLLDENNKPVVSHLNEELLQQIAAATKGFYMPLRGTKTMDTLYDRGIAPLPKTDNEVRLFQNFHEQYHWFLAIAILLLITEMFLPDRSRRRSSRGARAATAPNATTAVAETAAILLLLAIPMAVHGSPASALRDYNQGKYEDALKEYNQLIEKKKDDPRLHFNAGTAAYQAHQLDEASKEFNDALESQDLNLQERAYYNLGNTLYRIGEQSPDASKKQEAWENSMKQFESALKLNKQDGDAKFNEEFVKKQIEELKKQQQQQQSQSDKNSKQNQKNQQDQNQQNQEQQQNQRQQNNQQSQQNQSKSEQNSQANQAKQKSEQEKQQEQQQRQQQQGQNQKSNADKQQQDASQQQAQAGSKDKDKSSEEAKREAAMMAAGEMTPHQAEQLLDSQKDDEHVFQLAPPNKNTSVPRDYKNW